MASKQSAQDRYVKLSQLLAARSTKTQRAKSYYDIRINNLCVLSASGRNHLLTAINPSLSRLFSNAVDVRQQGANILRNTVVTPHPAFYTCP